MDMEFLFSIAHADDQIQIATNTGAWHAIASASFVVQLTLLTLIGMSVLTWTIVFFKRKQFGMVEKSNPIFEDEFWKTKTLDAIFDRLGEFPDSNLAAVFRLGYLEMKKIA